MFVRICRAEVGAATAGEGNGRGGMGGQRPGEGGEAFARSDAAGEASGQTATLSFVGELEMAPGHGCFKIASDYK